jgi:Cu+-exporting ATPase
VAEAVAAEAGAEEVCARVMPEQTAEVVERLRTEGRTGAMAGDGINDAAAPATADPGPGMGTDTDVAIEAETSRSYGVICTSQPSRSIARRAPATIKGNLYWAFGWNVTTPPRTTSGLLNPMIAGFTMALSSAFAVPNSMRPRSSS